MLSSELLLVLAPATVLAMPWSSRSSPSTPSYVSTMSLNTQGLFNESMAWMDRFWDPEAGYLYDESAAFALRHETRSSAYYAVGLLARNEDSDRDNAVTIITNVISGQYKEPKDQWYLFSISLCGFARVRADVLNLEVCYVSARARRANCWISSLPR